MKRLKLLSILVLLAAAGSGNVWADHGHTRIGVGMYFGGPPVSPWYYYPPPVYYPPRVVVVPAAPPPVYIEQYVAPAPPAPLAVAPAPAPQTNYWYYCRSSQAYYPYVKDCPEGWEQVLPQPSPR